MDVLRFDVTMSRSLASTTIGLLVMLTVMAVGVIALFLWVGGRAGWPSHLKIMTAVVVPLAVLPMVGAAVMTYLYAPSAYLVTDEAIIVQRPLSPITIPLASVQQVRRVDPRELAGTIRTMGADGMFARIGRFHSPALGNFRMYAKDMSKAVLVDAAERFVLSPDDPVGFIRAVLERRRSQLDVGGPQ